MYVPHLILKYLRKRRIAWVSLIAVTLCTTMVIVVISVMGGWLRMFRESFHGIGGDVVVSRRSLAGFPYYEPMLEKIRALPTVKAAAPTLQTYGLVSIANQIQDKVIVRGFDLAQMNEIGKFRQSLYRQWEEPNKIRNTTTRPAEERTVAAKLADGPATFSKPLSDDEYRAMYPDAADGLDVSSWPGAIVGYALVGIRKQHDGTWYGRENLYHASFRLTVIGVTDSTRRVKPEDQKPRDYWIVDDSRTNIFDFDNSSVYVPFDILQRDLGMNAREEAFTDKNTGQTQRDSFPARTSAIEIAVKDGVDPKVAKLAIKQIVDETLETHGFTNYSMDPVTALAWDEIDPQARFLAAVEKEKVLVVVLFSFISVVAVFLVFCIFFMIVAEKTRDIGIIKSVGGTNAGVARIFLGYGLAIGLAGGGLGLLLGYIVVHNINELHAAMAKFLGVEIWSAETYAFDTIPNTMNPREVAVIVGVAVLSSVAGALVPAIRAARLNPVEALRHE